MDLMLSLLETRTLPGWPEAYNPTPLDSLTVMVIIPALIAGVFALAVLGPRWFRTGDGERVPIEGGPREGQSSTAIEPAEQSDVDHADAAPVGARVADDGITTTRGGATRVAH